MNSLPIIFLHKGDSFYLKYALECAKKFNPNSRIILIGDGVTIYPDFVEYYNMNKFNKYGQKLEKNYVHLNTSNHEIEMFCIKRWFVLLEFMEKNNLKKIFTCDSDVLLYQNITDDSKNYAKFDCALGGGFTAGLIFINNINVLKKYVKRVLDFYKKINHFNNKESRISDMTFWKELVDSKKFKVGDVIKIINDAFYDFGFLSENFYLGKNKYGIKKFLFKNEIPFGQINNKLIRLKCIHFHGPTKFYMKYYLYGKNNVWINLKVNFFMWSRDTFSGKISDSLRNKIKKSMIKIGL